MKLKVATRQRRNHIPAQGNALGKPAPQSFALKGQHITCVHCGITWKPLDPKEARKSLVAATVNGDGPFCRLCRTLQEAVDAAFVRNLLDLSMDLRRLRSSLAFSPLPPLPPVKTSAVKIPA